jgi:hypothetical protein
MSKIDKLVMIQPKGGYIGIIKGAKFHKKQSDCVHKVLNFIN